MFWQPAAARQFGQLCALLLVMYQNMPNMPMQQPQGQPMTVQVPQGHAGGMMMQVHSPAGVMQVQIPMGLRTRGEDSNPRTVEPLLTDFACGLARRAWYGVSDCSADGGAANADAAAANADAAAANADAAAANADGGRGIFAANDHAAISTDASWHASSAEAALSRWRRWLGLRSRHGGRHDARRCHGR